MADEAIRPSPEPGVSFRQWLQAQRHRQDPVGGLARDVITDPALKGMRSHALTPRGAPLPAARRRGRRTHRLSRAQRRDAGTGARRGGVGPLRARDGGRGEPAALCPLDEAADRREAGPPRARPHARGGGARRPHEPRAGHERGKERVMAKIRRRTWLSRGVTGHKVKRTSWGFTTMVDGRRVRRYNAAWQTREDAERGLAACLLGIEEAKQNQQTAAPRGMTLGEAVERLLLEKSRHRSVDEYRRILERVLLPEFGTDTPLVDITASRISEHRGRRLAATSVRRRDADGQARALSAASINRPLALLRHLLRMARDEWEILEDAPRVRLEREPQGHLRWLSEAEEVRLLEACRRSRTPWLLGLVTVAMETGMRLGEILALTWEQIELGGRGVIRLERTKSGRRREIPMRPAVY